MTRRRCKARRRALGGGYKDATPGEALQLQIRDDVAFRRLSGRF